MPPFQTDIPAAAAKMLYTACGSTCHHCPTPSSKTPWLQNLHTRSIRHLVMLQRGLTLRDRLGGDRSAVAVPQTGDVWHLRYDPRRATVGEMCLKLVHLPSTMCQKQGAGLDLNPLSIVSVRQDHSALLFVVWTDLPAP